MDRNPNGYFMKHLYSKVKKPLLAFSLLVANVNAASSYEEYQQQMSSTQDQFQAYKQELLSEFEESKKEYAEYVKKVEAELEDYKSSLSKYWEDPEVFSKERWIEYSPDQKSRSEVDFEKNEITIQTIAKSADAATKKLEKVLERAVTIDTQTYRETNAIEQKIEKIKRKVAKKPIQAKPVTEAIISDVIFDVKPKVNQVINYVKKHVTPKKVVESPARVPGEKTYTIRIKLPPDTAVKKAQKYIAKIREEGSGQKVSESLILGIMQTESYFNPLARSHVPAFGLMQIVPKTAGVDAHNHLYGSKKVVSADYLYNSDNNIKMGTAYLHILYYKYFSKIKDPRSRLYCTIAAYNTGAGNVSWVFNRGKGFKYKLSVVNAVPTINAMSSDKVYEKLINELKHEEARDYLKRVVSRTQSFQKRKL